MIFSLRARGRVKSLGFYTIPYTRAHVVGVGLSNAGKYIFFRLERIFLRMRSPCTWESLNGCWMSVRWEYLYSSFVGLHIVALIPIRQYFSWFYFLQSKWNIESENLPDEVMNLRIFTIWLALSGCQPHTSSIWPWLGMPKVHLYNTFLGGLHQAVGVAVVVDGGKGGGSCGRGCSGGGGGEGGGQGGREGILIFD
jgi:hypothetical protein